MFQTEVIRQCVLGTLHSYVMTSRQYDIYEAANSILAFSINPLSNMLVWSETMKGIGFWRNKSVKFGNLLKESLKKAYLRCSQSY